jgi:Toprim-like
MLRRNPLSNLWHSTRCGRTPTGRLPEPTWLNSARFHRHWWMSCTVAVRSTPMITGPIRAWFFLHRDQHGKVRGATLRDTKHPSVFRPCLGNKLTAWFAVGDLAKADRVVAVESPIDALSYYSLFGRRGESLAVVSCAGATVPRELMLRAYDGRKAFVVALDNDLAGQRGRQKAREETLDRAGFKLSADCPKRKDWNDDLIALAERLSPPKLREIVSLRL